LTYAATPASDFSCGKLQLAGGVNLHGLTTGRGTPYDLAAAPLAKRPLKTSAGKFLR
jgi:galactarate dehydratase